MNSKSSDTSDPDLGILTEIHNPIGVTRDVLFLSNQCLIFVRRAEYLGACRPRALRSMCSVQAPLRQSIQYRETRLWVSSGLSCRL